MPAVALTIAGSDSSGGAGIQADLKTFTALGVYGASVITALTAQNTTGVQAVHAVPADFVMAQMTSVLDDLEVRAVKTGMLADADIIRAVADGLGRRPGIPLVVDPVMVATSGDPLLRPDAVATMKAVLIPRALLITPNLPEAAALTGTPLATTEVEAAAQLSALGRLGAGAVLLKGGHGAGDEAVDLLQIGTSVIRLAGPRIATVNTHGTGCTLSAAITAGLADGADLETAVRRAKAWLGEAIAAGAGQRIGHGHGPVDHLFAIRSAERTVGP
ncbi:MAG: bifunctional hydroxymethylpyrimidine kinase/phosphomethylpyrimidine kinase [Hyphomicrobiaceae bacterium]|nr:bifunctional hydroxymethylpyrimidine kinase/phosphomethylpyrimidine kinase [Hyphomicrobiaceae bacterium]